jgi:hypothetical protein
MVFGRGCIDASVPHRAYVNYLLKTFTVRDMKNFTHLHLQRFSKVNIADHLSTRNRPA